MGFTYPSVTDFKNYFVRDFPYGTDQSTSVLDSDIQSAINDALVIWNANLWGTQASFTSAYLWLSAHYLVTNLRASSQGISGQFGWLQVSRGAGGVSEGISVPPKILNNPYYSHLSKTHYGAKYLTVLWPRLLGNVISVYGGTNA